MTERDDSAAGDERFLTAGVDIGARNVKIAIVAHGGLAPQVVAKEIVAVLGARNARDAQVAVRESWARVLRVSGAAPPDIVLVASTGAREPAAAHVGHFYRRASLAAGVRFLFPHATGVLDIGARQMRCARLDDTALDRRYAATRKDAACGGQLLEAIARRGGVPIDRVGLLPAGAAAYDALAAHAARLFGTLRVDGPTMLTGALALDRAFVRVLARRLAEDRRLTTLLSSPDAIFAAAYGAALLAGRRYLRILDSTAHGRAARRAGRLSRLERLILN